MMIRASSPDPSLALTLLNRIPELRSPVQSKPSLAAPPHPPKDLPSHEMESMQLSFDTVRATGV